MKNEEKRLRFAAERLSREYRENGKVDLRDEVDVLAYVHARAPATSSVARVVLEEARELFGGVRSVVDLGAGPGSSIEAIFSALQPEKLTCIEKSELFISFGKKQSTEAIWVKGDFTQSNFEADVAYMGYSLGEVNEACMDRIWERVNKGIIIVEPGTPAGYQRLMRVRKKFIDKGGKVFAPCPHQNACPLIENDWCHFAVRVQRSALHRSLKGGDLGYEDEKFSYLIVTKEEAPYRGGRIIRHPQRRKGCVSLKICDKDGLIEKTISKKEKELYGNFNKIKWGSLL